MSLQILLSSSSTLASYEDTSPVLPPPFSTSLLLMEPIMRSEARRAPTTFLYATESRLRSSSERSADAAWATFFMYSTISS
eukprot:jgi/Chrpa1/19899/Chrysochromulina_OHIO_Genome00023803-RA